MRFAHRLSIIDSHTAGEPTRVIAGGYPRIAGDSLVEQMTTLETRMDWIRRTCMNEPRGHRDMFGGILLPPFHPDAHVGVIFMDGGRYYNMCGHASLGICGMLVETGRVPRTGRRTTVRIETPAGLVEGTVETTAEGSVLSVSLVDVASFALALDVGIDVPGHGLVRTDIAYGGNFFVIAKAADLGFSDVDPLRTNALIEAGVALRAAANAQIDVRHPVLSHIDRIDIAMLTGTPSGPHADGRNIVVLGAAQADRSPCGTGTCARLAVLHARGELDVGQPYRHESSIRTVFDAKIIGKTEIGGLPAIVPQIACRPFLTGFSEFVVDPDDPVGTGFVLG